MNRSWGDRRCGCESRGTKQREGRDTEVELTPELGCTAVEVKHRNES